MDEKEELGTEGRHRRLYEEALVQNIMLTTAYCIKDIMEENPDLADDDIYEFIEDNYLNIIQDTLDEFQQEQGGDGDEELLDEEEGKNNPAG